MNYEPLDRYLAQYNVYPTSFTDIREQAKEKYGERNWIGKVAMEISGATSKQDKEYKAARRSIERVNSGQYKAPSAKYQAGLTELGKTLNPISKNPPANGITLTIDFRETTGRRSPERSTPSLHMDYQTALQYINQARPDYAFLFDLWGDKKIGTNLFGEDGPYPADILDVS